MHIIFYAYHTYLAKVRDTVPFSSNFQKDAAFWENPEKFWSKFNKIQQNYDKICKFARKSAKFPATKIIFNEKI